MGRADAAAASGLDLINSVSNISGFTGPYFTGAIANAAGGFAYAPVAIAIIMAVRPIVLLSSGRRMERLDGNLS